MMDKIFCHAYDGITCVRGMERDASVVMFGNFARFYVSFYASIEKTFCNYSIYFVHMFFLVWFHSFVGLVFFGCSCILHHFVNESCFH